MQNTKESNSSENHHPLKLDHDKQTYFVVTVNSQYTDPVEELKPHLNTLGDLTLTLQGSVGPGLLKRELVVGADKEQMIQQSVTASEIAQRLKSLYMVEDAKMQTAEKRSKRGEV